MKRIHARLTKLTQQILSETNATPEEYKSYQEELKTLRELIATNRAYRAYAEDYGIDDDELDAVPKTKKVSGAKFK